MFTHYKTENKKCWQTEWKYPTRSDRQEISSAEMDVSLCMLLADLRFNLIALSILLNSDLYHLLQQLFLPGNVVILKYSRGKKQYTTESHPVSRMKLTFR